MEITHQKNQQDQVIPSPEELLAPSPTQDYTPHAYYSGFQLLSQRPAFTASTVQQMMSDPRVVYGLMLLKGPILTNAHVKVNCADENIRQYNIKQINRFWLNSAVRVMKAVEWGYSGSEVMYREGDDGRIHFDTVKDFYPPDVRLVTRNGNHCGINVRNVLGSSSPVFLGFPKAMYHLHHRDRNPWYGLSRLHGAHVPWWEIWSDGGYRDIRRLWFYKNAYEGGVVRHPPGTTRDEQGNPIPCSLYAREIVQKKRTGGVLTLPNTLANDQGAFAWTFEPPTPLPVPEGLLEYGNILRDEILEALGIPPEIIASGGDQGFGSSTGRQVPQMAFYSILQELFQWLLNDFYDYVLHPLNKIVFGENLPEIELVPFRLSEDLTQPSNGMDQGQGFGGGNDLSAKNFNGNQFQDENQRSVFMSHITAAIPASHSIMHFRSGRQWWTMDSARRTISPMLTAI